MSSITDRFHIWNVAENTLINKNGSLTIFWQLTGMNQLNMDENDFEQISRNHFQLLSQLPEKTEIQFLYDQYIKTNKDNTLNEIDTDIQDQARFLGEMRADFINKNQFLTIDIFLSVTFNHFLDKYDNKLPFQTYFLNPISVKKGLSETNFFNQLENIENYIQLVQRYFYPFNPLRLSDFAIIKLLSNFYNYEHDFDNPIYPADETFNKDLLKYNYACDKAGMTIGNNFLSVISMTELPTMIIDPVEVKSGQYKSALHVFFDLPYEFRLVLNLQKLVHSKTILKLKTHERMFNSLSAFSSLAKRKLEELNGSDEFPGIIEDLELNRDFMVNCSLTILSLYESKSQMNRLNEIFLSTFNDFYDAKAIVENLDALNLFLASAPANFQNHYRYFPMRASSAATLTNLTTHFSGHTKGINFFNKNKEVIQYDLFQSESNYNGYIIGPSGKGKSFTMNSILNQYNQQGVTAVILDVGASYKELVEAFDGQYIDIKPENPTNIDPFKYFNPHKNLKSKNSYIVLIQSFLELMLLRTDVKQIDLPKNHKSTLNKSIKSFFEANNSTDLSIHDYFQFVENDQNYFAEDEIMRSYALQALEFYLNTYPAFFDPANKQKLDFDFKQKLICYDLKGVERMTDLLPIYAYLISITVDQINSSNMDRFIFAMDEAWKFLQQSENIAKFAEEALRTFRKANGSIIIITQNIRDLTEGRLKDAIVNCNSKFILHHDKDHEIVKEYLNLNDKEYNAFTNLEFDRNNRDILISSNGEAIVVNVCFSEYDRWMYTTNPNEIQKREILKKQYGGDLKKAIMELIQGA